MHEIPRRHSLLQKESSLAFAISTAQLQDIVSGSAIFDKNSEPAAPLLKYPSLISSSLPDHAS
jgi:hypothetical protein